MFSILESFECLWVRVESREGFREVRGCFGVGD